MPAVLIVCVAVVQFIGLAVLGWARMSEGSPVQSMAQAAFYFMLLLVASTAAVTAGLGNALWPVCAVTFGVMVLGATVSSRRELEVV